LNIKLYINTHFIRHRENSRPYPDPLAREVMAVGCEKHTEYVVMYSSSTGPALGPYSIRNGPALAPCSINTGPALVPYSSSTRPALVPYSISTGTALGP
jgi:hypothetical protein